MNRSLVMGIREVLNSRYRVGTMMTSSPSLFVLLLLLSFTTVCLATPEGDTLQGLQQYWNVSFGRSWRGLRPCHHNWLGVTCDMKDGHVIGLNLTWNSTLVALGKPLPPSIGQLTNLQTLVLTNMSLTGTLTTEIGKLIQLKTLDLSENSIVGPIPEEITLCTNLHVLSFRQNNLGGQLPAFLGKLTKLVKLDLHKNSMWGGLPPEWGTMTAMQSMQLWENDLSGYIPDSWRNMTSMVNFGMGQLFLSGKVPDWFFHFPNMTTFNIPRNQFMGDFPTNIPHNSSNYSQFKAAQLECNYFTGPYPTNVPKPILFHNNCYIGQVDGDPAHDPGTTEYTQQNCKRTLSCPQFYKLVNQSNSGCAPCPNAQVLVDPSTCVCGKDVGSGKVLSIGGVVGGGGGGVVAILLLVLCLLLYKQKLDAQKNKYSLFGRQFEGINDPWEVPKEIKRFTLQELEKATQEFSDANCIGHGGFGHVYRGTLEDGKVVAIKCASLHSTQGQAEFRNELKLLSRLHHRNLVVLEGFCDDHGFQILVYEYLVNGNLHANLSGTKEEEKSADSPYLNAYQRLEVAVGIARGIEYLHSFADPPVIHRDLKPSNILLDEEMTAKIADFGISRVSAGRKTHVSTRALGTAGYQDPEYFIRLQLTPASDVYSFGIVLLELITGQQAIDYSRGADEFNLLEWVKPRYASGGISAILDPRLGGAHDAEMYKAMTDIALRCSMYDRTLRPTTKVILSTLEPFIKVEPPRRSLSFAWSREHSFNMAESGFIADVEGPNTEDLTTTSGSPPGHDAHRRISSDEARNQIDSHDRKPLEPR